MKSSRCIHLLVVISFFIYGCESATPSAISTQTESQIASLTVFPSADSPLPTHTKTLTPTATLTLTPPIPLGSKEAHSTIQALLREPVDCAAPCFWGITPGQTSFGEAMNIYARLGLQLNNTNTRGGKDFFEARHDVDDRLSISHLLTIQNDIVLNVRISITPEPHNQGKLREWQAYSPENLIARYGSPTRVDFFLGRASPQYSMVIYFNLVNLIAEYYSLKLNSKAIICPLADQYDWIRIWMGESHENPPSTGVDLEQATSITIKEFSELMLGDSDNACFKINGEAFP